MSAEEAEEASRALESEQAFWDGRWLFWCGCWVRGMDCGAFEEEDLVGYCMEGRQDPSNADW